MTPASRMTIAAAGILAAALGAGVLRAADGGPASASVARAPVYQCAMHPQIVSDRPGLCPICGMKLQRVDDPAPAVPAGRGRILFYRHPMRPDVTSPTPAKDEMGMDYVPVYEDEAGAASDVPDHAAFTIGSTAATVPSYRAPGSDGAVTTTGWPGRTRSASDSYTCA